MSIAVSVVVPVYNTSQYLKQCVDSLVGQSFRDVEFIFVDDGSTDNSVEILEQYQKLDNRIKILKQKNLNAGVARNNGMKEATGKYIIFLDSDDFFDLRMLEKLYKCAEKNKAEIVLFGFKQYDNVQQKISSYNLKLGAGFPKGVFTAEDLGDEVYSMTKMVPWNKFFLREFVDAHNLQFDDLKRCNDAFFSCMAVALAQRMSFLDKRYVSYRKNNPNSLSKSSDIGRESLIDSAMSIKKGLIEIGKYDGGIKASAVINFNKFVWRGIIPPYTFESLKNYYIYAKEHLIPDIFDSPSEFDENSVAKNIYESADFCNFLCKQLEAEKMGKKKRGMASSLEVRLAKALLVIPKRIYIKLKGYR